MTQEQKKSAIAQYLVSKGIVDPAEVEENIAKMAAQLAPATAQEKGLTTDIDKAYEVLQVSQGNATAPATATTAVTTAPTETISAAEKMAIAKGLVDERNDRMAVSANTTCEKYIFDRPAPQDWIKPGTVGKIDKESFEKLAEKWKGKVLADDPADTEGGIPSTTNYNILAAAAENQTDVAVYIGKLNTKPIGYIMNIGSAVGSGNNVKQMTREQVNNFLTLEAAGYVLASESKPGLRLRYIKPKNDPRHPGKIIEAKTVLADANKKNAVEAGSYEISRMITGEMKMVSLKSELAFKVDTGVKKANGEGNIIRVVRVPVKAEIPVLARKPEFVDVFKSTEKVSNSNLEFIPEAGSKLAQNISEAQQLAIATLRQKLNNPEEYENVAQFADKLKAFDPVGGGVSPAVTM